MRLTRTIEVLGWKRETLDEQRMNSRLNWSEPDALTPEETEQLWEQAWNGTSGCYRRVFLTNRWFLVSEEMP